jgi:hypothetical protein
MIFLTVSSHNYFGGNALAKLNASLLQSDPMYPYKIHIDADAAMNGVSRFGEIHPKKNQDIKAIYSKKENLSMDDFHEFDWLITSNSTLQKLFNNEFILVEVVQGSKAVIIDKAAFMKFSFVEGVALQLEDKIFIYKRS